MPRDPAPSPPVSDEDEEEDALQFDATEIVTRLFMGGEGCAHDAAGREQRGITHVLTVLSGFEQSFTPDAAMATDGRWMVVSRENRPTADLLGCFDACVNFINGALATRGAAVCVHSLEGQSRAPAVICAYLIKTLGMSLKDAMALLEGAEPPHDVNMNRGFWRQLSAYERAQRGPNARPSIPESEMPGAVMFERDELDAIIARFERAQAAETSLSVLARSASSDRVLQNQATKMQNKKRSSSMDHNEGPASPTSATGIGLMSLGSPRQGANKRKSWVSVNAMMPQESSESMAAAMAPLGKSPRGSFDEDPATVAHHHK